MSIKPYGTVNPRPGAQTQAEQTVRKVIEYHIHTSCCPDSQWADVHILEGKQWREAKKIAAKASFLNEDVCWVERVTLWHSPDGEIDREEEDLFYLADPHQGQPCPNY